MKVRLVVTSLAVMVALILTLGAGANAAVVGHLTQVQGRVDILKEGKLPATPVKVGDQVDAGDVLRSKSLSKAQITFIDSSVINLSPESRLAVEEYMFEPGQGKRRAILQLFRGLAHVVVNKIFKVEEPDFIIKTHTAVTGVRGTDFGVRLHPNASTILNFEGKTRVGNIFPETHTWERRAQKIALQSPGGGSFFAPGGFVDLHGMQGTTVQGNLPPTLPFAISPQDRQMFMTQVASGLLGRQGSGSGGPGGTGGGADVGPRGTGGGAAGTTSVSETGPGSSSLGLITGTGDTAVTLLNVVTVPPTVTPTVTPTPTPTPPTPPAPTPSTFNFTQQYYGGAWISTAAAPYSQTSLLLYSCGLRTGVYDGYFYGTGEGTRTSPGGVTDYYPSLMTGTNTATATGTVTGFLGQALTGTMDTILTIPSGSTVTRTGTVTILPTGELTYTWTDTMTGPGGVAQGTGTGVSTQTPGTYFTQTASGSSTNTANLAGNQVTSTSSGDMTGTRTMAGVTSSFRSGFSVNTTAPNAGTFSSGGPYTTSETSQGVLGPPDANGVRTGVMINNVTMGGNTFVSGGPVSQVPGTESTPEAMFSQRIKEIVGTNYTSLGISAQTPDTAANIVTQTYEGSGALATSAPYSSATLTGTGWGRRSGTGAAGPFTTPTYGSLTASLTDTSGGTFNPGSETLNYTSAAVVRQDGAGNYHGPAQGIGVSAPHTVLSTAGTVTVNSPDSSTNNFGGTWFSAGSKGTITAGTKTSTDGTYFTQTTNAGTGTVTRSAPTTIAPYTQTSTLAANMTRTGVAPTPNQVLTPSSIITSVTNVPNALPAAGAAPAIINMEGVVPSSGCIRNGSMTMTVHQAAGAPVSTYMSPVTINACTGTLAATNLVGKNMANPGVNRAPATQTGAVASQPAPAP